MAYPKKPGIGGGSWDLWVDIVGKCSLMGLLDPLGDPLDPLDALV